MDLLDSPTTEVDRSECAKANVDMFCAIASRDLEKLRGALVAGAKPTQVNEDGYCPLHLALHQISCHNFYAPSKDQSLIQCEGHYESDSGSSETSDSDDNDADEDEDEDDESVVDSDDSDASDNCSYDLELWNVYDSDHSDSSYSCRSFDSTKNTFTAQAKKAQVVADMVELLLEQGANPNCKSKEGKTLLYNVIRFKSDQTNTHVLKFASKLINLFFSYGVSWNYNMKKSRYHPFYLALKRKNDQALRLFLEHGFQLEEIDVILFRFRSWDKILVMDVFEILARADMFQVNTKCKKGYTALYTLMMRDELLSMDRVRLLVDLGAEINMVDDCVDRSLMFLAADIDRLDFNTYCELIHLLVTHGGDLIENYGYGRPTPMAMIILNGNWDLVEWCLDRAIESGKTIDELNAIDPLCEAMGDEEMFNGLILRRFDVRHKNINGGTALHSAIEYDVRYAATLLEWGADVNSANKWGDTPLHYSCGLCSESLTELLLSYGADINCKTTRNEFPIDMVMKFPRGSKTQKRVMEPIVAQVVIEQSEGRPVDEQYMTYIRNNLSDFYRQCQTEIAVAQTSSFIHLLTFYDLLTSNNLRYHISNGFSYDPSVSDILMCQYPIYGKRMNDRLQRAYQQNEFLMKAKQSLSRILGFNHDAFHPIFDMIIRHLSRLDLHNLGKI
ncbi:hypothetical protein QAD02_010541 [Eretmocerus hayati]|uniref:Uncharacterized protein n=1 Tax=Eretmocerus hayati TaxID=131215 RepID=A0ACC2NU37_9HYME|nr:hypothetical protein QAD02_010541 [Eretmocerus hayati]